MLAAVQASASLPRCLSCCSPPCDSGDPTVLRPDSTKFRAESLREKSTTGRPRPKSYIPGLRNPRNPGIYQAYMRNTTTSVLIFLNPSFLEVPEDDKGARLWRRRRSC